VSDPPHSDADLVHAPEVLMPSSEAEAAILWRNRFTKVCEIPSRLPISRAVKPSAKPNKVSFSLGVSRLDKAAIISRALISSQKAPSGSGKLDKPVPSSADAGLGVCAW
jgi:hypothetical protein